MLFIQALNECTKYNPSFCLLVCRKDRVKIWLQQAHARWKADQKNLPLSKVLLTSDPKSLKGECSGLV